MKTHDPVRMYICICKAVTDKQIRRAQAEGVATLEELRETLGVTSCCGGCTGTVEAMLEERDSPAAPAMPRLYVPSAA